MLFFIGLKYEFEAAKVNESSVFEPLKFYFIFIFQEFSGLNVV